MSRLGTALVKFANLRLSSRETPSLSKRLSRYARTADLRWSGINMGERYRVEAVVARDL